MQHARRTATIFALACGLSVLATPAATAASPAKTVTVHVWPGQSIATALTRAPSGATVAVHAGTYAAVSVSARRWTSPVTVKPAGDGAVTIDGVTLARVTNLTLRGVRTTKQILIDGGSRIDVVGSRPSQITVKNGAADIELVDNDIVGGWNGIGISSWGGAARPHHVRIAGNRLSGQANDNIQIGVADDVTIEDNVLRDPIANEHHNDGIQFMGGDRLTVRRNRFSGQDQAMMIQPEAVLGAGTRVLDARLESNIVSTTRGAGFIVSGTVGTRVVNNTIYDTKYASVHLIGANKELVIANNVLQQLWRQSGAAVPRFEDHNCVARGGTGAHDVSADPRFVDRVDYRLTTTSPCRSIALATYAPRDDIDGTRRGAPVDAGAREV